jgi:hypothetical protein
MMLWAYTWLDAVYAFEIEDHSDWGFVLDCCGGVCAWVHAADVCEIGWSGSGAWRW